LELEEDKNKTRGRRRDEVPDPVLFKLEEEEQDDSWLKPRNRGSERRRRFVPKTNKSWQLPRKTISWRKNMTNMIISDGGEVNTHTDNCCSWKKKNKTRGRRRDEVPNPVLFKLEEEQQDDTWPKTKESSCSSSHVDILN
jgi:hypothetical protein